MIRLHNASTITTKMCVSVGIITDASATSLDKTGTFSLEVVNGWCSEQPHSTVQLDLENFVSFANTVFTTCCKTPQVWLAHTDRIGTQREGLGNICSTLDSSIHDNFDIGTNSFPNGWQYINGSRRCFQLSGTMVGYPYGGEANFDGLFGVVRSDNALGSGWAVPFTKKPFGVGPAEFGSDLTVHKGSQGVSWDVRVDAGVGVRFV
mmetsp:Transcript_954/g.1720  ORF Transcript_954/g.1720 Transcript_954/m.1720 type:complete len:206 (+) Transcript_954:88-705(+)